MDEGKDIITSEGMQEYKKEEIHNATPRHKFLKDIGEIIKVIFISLIIVLPVRYFIAQPFIVRGASMEPNFEDNQYLIVDEASYFIRTPERGEVIIFHYPRDSRQFFIKRIIGLPGERIKIYQGRVTIFNETHANGLLLDESYLNPPNYLTYPDLEMTLGLSEYFVMGDNRDFSSDSRFWGSLDKKYIVGRALFRAWPIGQFGLLNK